MEKKISNIKRIGWVFFLLCAAAEMILFPSWGNACGCLMMLCCWGIFCDVGLKFNIIANHLTPWLIFVSMAIYRIFPLPLTLIEGHPVSYLMAIPVETFISETILFSLSAIAFSLAIRYSSRHRMLRPMLYRLHFYDVFSQNTIIAIGLVGFAITLFSRGYSWISEFAYLRLAPIVLYFPILCKRDSKVVFKYSHFLTFYVVVVTLYSLAANSRHRMIEPAATFVMLFFVAQVMAVVRGVPTYKIAHKYYVIIISVGVVVGTAFSAINSSMLANRGMKLVEGASNLETFEKTLSDAMNNADDAPDTKSSGSNRKSKSTYISPDEIEYDYEWTEEYIDNFALNRYCNMRITDATLYHASRIGYANDQMIEDFFAQILIYVPQSILDLFDSKFDKSEHYFSRGDLIYSMSTNTGLIAGYRVTSHIGDGLATFGLLAFAIIPFVFFLEFLLVDQYCYGKGIFSLFAFVKVFIFLGMYRNAGGVLNEIGYLLRGFWLGIVFCSIVIFIVRLFVSSMRPLSINNSPCASSTSTATR